MELLALAVVALAALVLQHAQHREAERAWRLERIGLLNRIQGAVTYQPDEKVEVSDEPLYIEQDDDEGYGDYVERRKAGELV